MSARGRTKVCVAFNARVLASKLLPYWQSSEAFCVREAGTETQQQVLANRIPCFPN